MKLLIADDEELTRTGVISSIDWASLGIDEIFQADDGVHGLEMALLHRPEIILCDVRMPRMTGIEMLERLEKSLPDSIPIFMSGYSDKDYLKAAIKLKAVNYIEKPINPAEIREAVLEAVGLYNQKLRSRRGETLRSMEAASRLAYLLTDSRNSREEIEPLAAELSLPFSPGTSFASIVLHLSRPAENPGFASGTEILSSLREILRPYHADCIHVDKRPQYPVYFLFGSSGLSNSLLLRAADFLKSAYGEFGEHFIAIGNTVCGVSRAQQSYTAAVLLLQSSFFFPAGFILTPRNTEGFSCAALPPDGETVYAELLAGQNEEECIDFLDHLRAVCRCSTTLLPDRVKDLYYKLFLALENARRQRKLPGRAEQVSIVSFMEECFTYDRLHGKLAAETADFFEALKHATPENPTIFLIKEYISKNYGNETLSVKDISDQVFLSASYVCTFFKNETGQTLNQYLTEYRMEKAKSLLADPRYKITEISSRVGYSDGNYFSKSFRKYTGLSPSEYRERTS